MQDAYGKITNIELNDYLKPLKTSCRTESSREHWLRNTAQCKYYTSYLDEIKHKNATSIFDCLKTIISKTFAMNNYISHLHPISIFLRTQQDSSLPQSL